MSSSEFTTLFKKIKRKKKNTKGGLDNSLDEKDSAKACEENIKNSQFQAGLNINESLIAKSLSGINKKIKDMTMNYENKKAAQNKVQPPSYINIYSKRPNSNKNRNNSCNHTKNSNLNDKIPTCSSKQRGRSVNNDCSKDYIKKDIFDMKKRKNSETSNKYPGYNCTESKQKKNDGLQIRKNYPTGERKYSTNCTGSTNNKNLYSKDNNNRITPRSLDAYKYNFVEPTKNSHQFESQISKIKFIEFN